VAALENSQAGIGLPYAISGDFRVGGVLKAKPDDFVVEEIPAYTPSGAGEHLYLRFEKRGLDTDEAVKRIARALEVDPRDAGTAGKKDRHATTTQWASFGGASEERAAAIAIDGIRVLEVARHGNKLRTGHLRGNRFVVRLRGAPAECVGRAREVLAELAARGVPGYFGVQRFGRDAGNVAAARAWIVEGGPAPRAPWARKLLVSSLQSELFNQLCGERVRDDTYGRVLAGDVVRKEESGGLFVPQTPDELADAQARAASFLVSPTGPMFGISMRAAEGAIAEREASCLAAAGLDEGMLARIARAGEGTRRPYRFALGEPEVEADEHGIVLRFVLPPGAYATVVVRELQHDG
jgi:tRNA pseudouridine13 synthase